MANVTKPTGERLLTLEQIRKGLKDRKLHRVALYTELSYPTLNNLMRGKNNPTYNTILALSNYLIHGAPGISGTVLAVGASSDVGVIDKNGAVIPTPAKIDLLS